MKTTWLLNIAVLFVGQANCQTNQIVFVCEHGSAKSIIAATYFNKLAKEQNIPWLAISRGTDPDAEISPKTRALLMRENLLNNSLVPQKINQTDVDASQQVVLFFPLPADIGTKNNTRNWLEVQAMNDDYKKLRDDILLKLVPLIDSLANHK
ncbi:MAG: hypothetical protein HOP08_18765 [Cyclobacteriaceae bacterium]|nr:hypothetical protein [Cyclobacteriaceae bacterium]